MATIGRGCPHCSGCMCNCLYKFEHGKEYRKSSEHICYYHQRTDEWIEV